MADTAKIVKLKLDIIFKRVFGDSKNDKIIKAFLSALLEIPAQHINAVTIENVELPPDELEQKFSRLDLRLDVDGKTVNIEIQVNFQYDYRERTLFYWSKMFSNELGSGEEYGSLPQTICINIVNFNLFSKPEYHSHYSIMDRDTHEILTDKFAIHFFELKKVGKNRTGKPMDDWINLINAETEEELMAIQQTTTIPEVKDTIVILRELSADEQLRRLAEMREKRLHDEASNLNGARREGIEQGIKQGIEQGITEGKAELRKEKIAQMRELGFTEEQIKAIWG